MKHLKLFETEVQYESFKGSSDFVLPNVSHTIDTNKVFYNAMEYGLVYNMVDLGLPSGLKWADRNVGADSPEAAGLYFAWGETVGYTADQINNGEKDFSSDWSDYFDGDGSTFNKYATDKLTRLEASDDAASVNMGADWRMPTQAEAQELIDNTTVVFIDLQGNEFSQSEAQSGAIAEYNLKGVKLVSKTNGNSIFIPALGFCNDSTLNNAGLGCGLWSSDLNSLKSMNARCLDVNYGGYLNISSLKRYFGLSVRAVHA